MSEPAATGQRRQHHIQNRPDPPVIVVEQHNVAEAAPVPALPSRNEIASASLRHRQSHRCRATRSCTATISRRAASHKPERQSAERRTEEYGTRHEFLSLPHVREDTANVSETWNRMCERMIAQRVSGVRDALNEYRIGNSLPDEEERGPRAERREPVQYRGRVFGVRSVVEGEEDTGAESFCPLRERCGSG